MHQFRFLGQTIQIIVKSTPPLAQFKHAQHQVLRHDRIIHIGLRRTAQIVYGTVGMPMCHLSLSFRFHSKFGLPFLPSF